MDTTAECFAETQPADIVSQKLEGLWDRFEGVYTPVGPDTARQANPAWREIHVTSERLDHFFDERGSTPPITFVKCDANYHELSVLRGGLRTLRASHPAILIEVNPNPDDHTTTAFENFELLRAEGYSPYWFDGEKLLPRKAGERSQNYFFLTPRHVSALAGYLESPVTQSSGKL